MKLTIRNQLALAASTFAMVLAVPAFAQEDAARVGDESTGDIIVTARRVEEKLQDVPISITVYTQEAITSRNIFNAADLATYTPSLSSNSKFGPEKASFAIRGFQQDLATAPSVGVYFAEVVGQRSGASTTSGNGVGVGALFDLQNVQVLKGPQGTLFGRNTTGGAVLLVPKKPTDQLEGYVEASGGSYGMRRGQAVINIPLADTFKVRLGVDKMKRDGYLKNHSGIGPDRLANTDYISARLSIVADLTPDLENYTIATFSESDNHGYVPRVMACYNVANTAGPGGTPRPPAGYQGLGYAFGCGQMARQAGRVGGADGWWDVENSEPNPRQYTQSWQVINTTTWQASDTLTVKNILAYGEFRETSRFSLEGENFIVPGYNIPYNRLIRIGNTPGYNNASQSNFTEELQFQGRTEDGKLNWQAGGFMEVSNPLGYNSQLTPFFLSCTNASAYQCNAGVSTVSGGTTVYVSNISQPYQKSWFRSKGVYAQGTYHFTDQLSTTAGLRYTWDSHKNYYAGTGIGFPANNTPVGFCNNPIANPGPGGPGGAIKIITPGDFHQCDNTVSTSSKKPTWLIDLDYKPTDDILLYAKYARGYRAGGVNAPYSGYTTWGPEKVESYEVGAKASFRGSSVRGYFNIAGFYNDFSNQQIQATLNAKSGAPILGGTAILNAGKSRIWGVEVDAAVTLFDSLKLEGGYTYLNTELLELTGVPADDNNVWVPGALPWRAVIPTAVKGGPLSLSPKHRFSVTGTYTLPLDESIGKISFGATYVYTAKQFASRAIDVPFATGQLNFYPGFPVQNPGIMPASKLLNLNASWNNVLGQPVDLSFFMTNVTNEAFPLNLQNAFPSFGIESQVPNEPRMWGARLRYRFGN